HISVFFCLHKYHCFLDVFSSPTRRSSDLLDNAQSLCRSYQHNADSRNQTGPTQATHPHWHTQHALLRAQQPQANVNRPYLARKRSEEHTSELQSRENLVCRLLLDKKK